MQIYTLEMFDGPFPERQIEPIAPGAWLLRAFCLDAVPEIVAAIERVTVAAPFRHLVTPGGFRMSVGMTNCGSVGWVSDRSGYRYETDDPLSGKPWPAMPDELRELARQAAESVEFENFEPDACLINRYQPGDRLTLHQDKDENQLAAPIVSVSLGLPAVFLFGGMARSDRPRRIPLQHGDIVVWGGPARLSFHGVLPIKAGHHLSLGSKRLNLTFRRAR